MVLSKNAGANIRFISDCLEEADIGTDRNNVIYIQHGVVMIVSPEEGSDLDIAGVFMPAAETTKGECICRILL